MKEFFEENVEEKFLKYVYKVYGELRHIENARKRSRSSIKLLIW